MVNKIYFTDEDKRKSKCEEARRYRKRHPERVKEYQKKYSKTKGAKKIYKNWRDKNPDYDKEYRKKNKEKIAQQKKEYSLKNRKKINKYSNDYQKQQRDVLRKLIAQKCEDCGGDKKLCIHHKDRNHQNNNPKNLRILCRSCHANEHLKDKIRNKNGQFNRKI